MVKIREVAVPPEEWTSVGGRGDEEDCGRAVSLVAVCSVFVVVVVAARPPHRGRLLLFLQCDCNGFLPAEVMATALTAFKIKLSSSPPPAVYSHFCNLPDTSFF